MKHPHCNRSLAAHLFWCRGFTPVFFIVMVALFVVSVGSGIYFASRPDAVLAPSEAVAVKEQANHASAIATPTEDVAVVAEPMVMKPDAASTVVPEVKPVATPKPAQTKPIDCGVGAGADTCMFESIASCTPAKATLIDESTGVRVEHIVSGLVGGKCLYQSTITSAPDEYAILEGLDVRCDLSKEQLLQVLQAIDEEQLLQLCTGSYVDILRQARGMEPSVQ